VSCEAVATKGLARAWGAFVTADSSGVETVSIRKPF
jgi:hypothetical protein